MKNIIKNYCVLFTFILINSGISAQCTFLENYNKRLQGIFQEKIYLHTDRNIYYGNETLWFTIYLSDARFHLPFPGINTVYVNLTNSNGEIFYHKPFLVENGIGYGDIILSDSLNSGRYILYAYTSYMKSICTDAFFKKDITISQIKNGKAHYYQQDKNSHSGSQSGSLKFMPEGGYLSSNIPNNLAFKYVGLHGKGIDFTGSLIDSNGALITRIDGVHHGMGKIQFTPKHGMKYYVISELFPQDSFQLPESNYRPLLQYSGIIDSSVQFQIRDLTNDSARYYLAIMAKGELTFYLERFISGPSTMFNIHINNFTPGINKATLLDQNYIPVAERMFYIPGIKQAPISIMTDQNTYNTRSKTEVVLQLQNEEDIRAGGNLSMAVIHLDEAGISEIPDENIISWLELSSELKGEIEFPGEYFSQPYEVVKDKLDLLLLTQGWSKYIWDEEHIKNIPIAGYTIESGLSINGLAQKLTGNKGIEEGDIILFAPGESILEETKTDSEGNFIFKNVVLFDSTKVMLQSQNKKNKPFTRIMDFSYNVPSPPRYEKTENFYIDTVFLRSFNELAVKRFMTEQYHNFEKDHVLLEQVTVTAKRKETDDGHFRRYSQANNVIDMDEHPYAGYADIFSFLYGMVPGLHVIEDKFYIRSSVGPALIILDGNVIDAEGTKAIPMEVIDKIEVCKDASNTAVFGVKGGDGVIAIYTRRGEVVFTETPTFGIISKTISGFANSREFYAPDYENTEIPFPTIDKRATLYWNPAIVPDSTGMATLSFFNSDDNGKVAIIIEGILDNGKPISHQSFYYIERGNK
jgi:hypothetical protein